MTKKHTLWIGIDPNILLQGLDTTELFKCDNYLKFNLGSNNDKERKRIECNNQTKTKGNDRSDTAEGLNEEVKDQKTTNYSIRSKANPGIEEINDQKSSIDVNVVRSHSNVTKVGSLSSRRAI